MKPLTAGSEIDAYCTKCRMDLGHRIVAMVTSKPKRVICLTCGSQHNYRAPASEKAAGRRRVPGAPRSAAERVTQKARAEADRVNEWESRIAGQAHDAFERYAMDKRFAAGQLIQHKKFGEGYVVDVVDGGKVNIMFRDGMKTLAHGMT
ncbi:MAG: hypothetical protein R3B13_24060 [Polyangiaceae bacterium]